MKKYILLIAAISFLSFQACTKSGEENGGKEPEEETGDVTEYTEIADPEDIDENSKVPAEELAGTIRIMTFNINNQTGKNSDPFLTVWGRRRDPVVRMLKDKMPDVCFFQEIQGTMVNYIYDCMKENYWLISYDQKAGGTYKMGFLVNKNKLEVVKNEPKWFSETPDVPYSNSWDCPDYIKMAVLATFKIKATGKEFYAAGAHFFPSGTTGRTMCSTLMAQWAQENAGTTMPAICCGDMNIQNDDAMLKPLYNVMDDAVDHAKHSDGRDAKTYNRFGTTPYKNLDHMFYRNATPVTYRVVNDEKAYGLQYLSDHYAIYCDFNF